MLKFFSKRMNNKKGFTLIELIVVIAILAILALIAIPRIGSFRAGAAVSAHNANVRALESAASMCLAEKGLPENTITWKGDDQKGDGEHLWEAYIADWPKVPKGTGKSDLTSHENAPYEVTITSGGGVTVTPKLIPDNAT